MTADPLRSAARERPEATAVRGPAEAWSYGRLDAEADGVAGAVRARGVGPGERVAVLLPRGLRAVTAIHAVPRTGAALCMLHPRWTREERIRYLELVEPAAAVCGPETVRDLAAALPGVPRLVLERQSSDPGLVRSDRVREGPDQDALVTPDPHADHSLVATSGTGSGTADAVGPRAVRLTLSNHLASARGARERLALGPDDRWLATLSLAHVGGLAMVVRAAVVGCELVVRTGFDPAELVRLVRRGDVTHVSLVPVMLRRLVAELEEDRTSPDGLRRVLVGGAATPEELLVRALDAGLPVSLTYGLTEACSQVATAPPELVRRKPGTVGSPLPGLEVQLGSDGEILVRGPTLAAGLVTREGEEPLPLEDDWLRTGDAGRMDDEGHLWITGRLDERVVTGGTTVDPAEVERVVRDHPSVEECAVVGVPDPEWGERIAAAVVPRSSAPDMDAGERAQVDRGGSHRSNRSGRSPRAPRAEELRRDLEEHCRQRLSSSRRPRSWSFLVELPRNANGKVDRAALRELMGPGSVR